LKPDVKATQTPKDEEAKEPSPGTSRDEGTKELSPGLSEENRDKYKSTGRAMILSPDGKLIPFRMTDKITKEAAQNEDGNASDPHLYCYFMFEVVKYI